MPVFLFTDIEGSTEKWEKHRDVMGPVLARHDALLREAVETHGGAVVKTTGDGIHAVFMGGEPLAAALAIQRSVQGEDWGALSAGAVPELRVRVGLHAGQAEARDGDWYGPAVNRAARVMAAAHGGQVLATGAALAACPLPPDARAEAFGLHLLKDLEEAMPLSGITHPGLRLREFPPPRTLTGRTHNLPASLTPFVGRGAELERLAVLLADPGSRLVTLLGQGGTGKSRLAAQAAAAAIDGFPGGVYFIEAAPVARIELLPGVVAATMGLSFQEGTDQQASLARAIGDRALLLVLDNLEHLLEGLSWLAVLLRACPRLHLVCTSRARLGLSGETVLDLGGLSVAEDPATGGGLPPALALFMQSARRLDAAFALDAVSEPAVREICRLVDGMPLGIELAASWVRVLGCPEIAAQIQESRLALSTAMRDLPARHRSLRAVMSHSWDLLPPAAAMSLAALSVFRGGASRSAAKAVAGCDDAMTLLLLDRSLLRRDGRGRLEMHELVRQFAEERLAADPALEERVNGLHFAWAFRRLVEGLGALTVDSAMRLVPQLAADRDNFRFRPVRLPSFVPTDQPGGADSKDLFPFLPMGPGREIPIKALGLAAARWHALISSGVPVLQSLPCVIAESDSPSLKVMLEAARTSIAAGDDISSAFTQHGMGPAFVAVIGVGEAGGILDQTLEWLAILYGRWEELRGGATHAEMERDLFTPGYARLLLQAWRNGGTPAGMIEALERKISELGSG